MTRFPNTRMAFVWVDPLHGLLHALYKVTWVPPVGVSRVWYNTGCGLPLTVDDVNHKTTVDGIPSCLACVVAVPKPGVLNGGT